MESKKWGWLAGLGGLAALFFLLKAKPTGAIPTPDVTVVSLTWD